MQLKGFIVKILRRTNYLFAFLLLLSYLSVYVHPRTFWPLSIFGLLYPVFFIVNLFFIILWSFRKNKFLIISLLVILVGWSFMTRNIQVTFPFLHRQQSVDPPIKIMSYNVRLFNLYKWIDSPDAIDEIMDFVEEESPDIICLQDFYTRKRGKFSETEINTRLKKNKYRFIKYTLKKPGISSYGIATYSAYPIINSGVISFANSFNVCIYTDIIIRNDTIRLFNTHLQSYRFIKQNYDLVDSLRFEYNTEQFKGIRDIAYRLKTGFIKRSVQTDTVSAYIKRSPYPVVVCGDFNDSPVSYTYQHMRGNLKDAFIEAGTGIGFTYVGKFPSYRIDYILHDNRFKAIDYKSPGMKLSDHRPVICKLLPTNRK